MATSLNIYGIKTCDTVRKARRWLDTHHVEHTFLDLREDNTLTDSGIRHWLSQVPAGNLVNKRSTTWKQLDAAQRDAVSTWIDDDAHQALLIEFLKANPTLVKRPVFEHGDDVWVGFNADQLQIRF